MFNYNIYKMLKTKLYNCKICKTKLDQISHHKNHLETQKHKDKKELFELKLSKLSSNELLKLHNTTDLQVIIDENETNTFIDRDTLHLLTNDKKLINSHINDESNNDNIKMSTSDLHNIEQSNNITNKEALRDKIHEIHNYLRNNGAGYGMNALKVFNLLYGLKKLEEKNLLDKVGLKRPECEFSYLLTLANENKEKDDEKLSDLIIGSVSKSIYYSIINELLFYEIPSSIKSSVFSHLIKEINKITIIEKTCNVLLSGKIYEYFIGRDQTAISELGAYFTDRHIVDYIYKKLDPEINENESINSMIDMFGGSGGFTTGYINYLNNKYDNIDWKNNINKIYHFDMNEDVVKSAGLEFFCLTGELPDMKDNLAYRNSFSDAFNNKKFMNVVTNPPYGGDKTVQSDAQIKRKKIKEYIKKELLTLKDELKIKIKQRQLIKIEKEEKQDKIDSDKTKVSVDSCSQRIQKFAKDNKLSGNDKESCSLMLIMDMVDVGGTAIGVLKEGVFFNKTYKDIRKCLVQNFNVREIISVPQDQFENTSTKTSIVIFDNTIKKTSNVKFYDLVVEKYTEDKFEEINGEIVLTENKDDICGISDRLISEATKDEILKNAICSLNGKDYNKKEIVVSKDYELKKIDDICEFTKYKSQKPSNGEFNYYTCSNTIKKCSDGNINGEYILIGTRGTITEALHYYNGKFGCGDNMLIFNSNTINNKYIYNILLSTKEQIKNYINGSTIPMISLSQFKNIQVPIPKSQAKITEWVNKISKPYDKKNKNEQLIIKLQDDIKSRIKYIEDKEECDEVELESICDTQSGEYLTKNNMISGIFPVYGGGGISNYINKYNHENKIIINKDGVSLNCVKFEYGKFFLNHHGWVIIYKNKDIKNYINYWLFNNQEKIYKLATGSAQKGINKENFLKLKIKIPKNKKVILDLESFIIEIEKLQIEMKEADTQYKQLINELSEEAIPTNKQIEIKSDDEINELSEQLDEEIIEVKETKKKSTKKVKVDELVQEVIETSSEQPSQKKKKSTKKVKTESNTI